MNKRVLSLSAILVAGFGVGVSVAIVRSLLGSGVVDTHAPDTEPASRSAAAAIAAATIDSRWPATPAPERQRADGREPERDAHDLARWVPGIELLEGRLSAGEVAVANVYVEPMLTTAIESLRELSVDAQDPTFLAQEARRVRRIELWKAVSQSLHDGDYLLMKETPSSWRNPPGQILQPLPTWRDGQTVTMLFVLDLAQHPGLRDAQVYQTDMHRFRLQEAARRHNQLASAERERRYRDYRRLREDRGSWAALPAELRRSFPLENQVFEGSFLMGTPY